MKHGQLEVFPDLEAEAKYWMDALNNPHLEYQTELAALICTHIKTKLTALYHPPNPLNYSRPQKDEDDDGSDIFDQYYEPSPLDDDPENSGYPREAEDDVRDDENS